MSISEFLIKVKEAIGEIIIIGRKKWIENKETAIYNSYILGIYFNNNKFNNVYKKILLCHIYFCEWSYFFLSPTLEYSKIYNLKIKKLLETISLIYMRQLYNNFYYYYTFKPIFNHSRDHLSSGDQIDDYE